MISTINGNRLVPALFLHIPKTAGSSIVDLAKWHYKENNVISHGDFMNLKPEECKEKLFLSGHFEFHFAYGFLHDRYSFTFLRNPVERILSLYHFSLTRDPNENPIYRLSQDLDLASFLRAAFDNVIIKKAVLNRQTGFLAQWNNYNSEYFSIFDTPEITISRAIAHLSKLSHVGFTETFEHDMKIILSALNIPLPEGEVRVNVTEDRPSFSDVSDEVKELLRKVTEVDQVLYDRVWASRAAHGKAEEHERH